MPHFENSAFQNLNIFYGDIHNHCDLSYGHGSLQAALSNARLQLDFVSVTVHAVWHDLPTDDPNLSYLVDYHKEGFLQAQANWAGYLTNIQQANVDGKFVTFPSFEWHSMAYGDHCVYYKQAHEGLPIIDARDLPTLRQNLRDVNCPAFMIPHHIGYRQGSRGINWQAFTDEMSPIAEIFSFHGLSEGSEGSYPYLHSMGPRHEQSTAQYGWSQGNVFGVVGSTDHHNAFPGSYGYGRMGVWAESLSQDAIWDAIQNRRTYALTGDRIELGFSLNGQPIGSICPVNENRTIDVAVQAGGSIDYIEVLHNNRIIHRESVFSQPADAGRYKVYIEMGWGEQDGAFKWDVSIEVDHGNLLAVEPRFRGIEPTAGAADVDFAYCDLAHDDNHMHLRTKTFRNPSLHTPATEGAALEIEGTSDTCLRLTANGKTEDLSLRDIMTGTRTFYMGGFVSPAICVHRAVPQNEYQKHFTLTHHSQSSDRDWYYVRVRQRNNQWAWSSPIWVEGSSTQDAISITGHTGESGDGSTCDNLSGKE